ncbi:MAG: peptidase S10 [Planctomycetota bacterium]
MKTVLLPAIALIALLASVGRGQSPEAPAKPNELADHIVRSSQSIALGGGKRLGYDVACGTMVLRDDAGKARAEVFHVAYTVPAPEGEPRPVTFVFNGGPGSSSVWLHLGAVGPKRVLMTDDGAALPPPGRLVDNPFTWLIESDLVFIDPVGTGYSRPAEGVSGKEFWGVDEDVSSVGDFIRLWVTRNQRWTSAKFLAGESYGTTRAAGLSGYLQENLDLYVNGICLISPILDFSTARFDVGNDLPYPLFLPTYVATAFHHGRLDEELQRDLGATLARAESFALGEYWSALALGDRLGEERRRAVVAEYARLTGLPADFVERAGLRVTMSRFTKELMRDAGKTVGRLDSRYLGIDRDGNDAAPDYDPSLSAITGPYTAALNAYVREELGFVCDREYRILTGAVQPWSYDRAKNRYLNVAETLRAAMTRNPALRVWVASGRFDLATPYFAMDYTLSHMGLDPTLRGNVRSTFYDAGHMMYVHRPSLEALQRDWQSFLRTVPRLPR